MTFSIKPAFFGSSQVALVAKNLSASAGDERHVGLIPGSGRYPGEGNGNPLQYPCQENPMDRRAWQATAHGVARVIHDLVTKPPFCNNNKLHYREE